MLVTSKIHIKSLMRGIAAMALLVLAFLPLSANAITVVQQKLGTVKTTTTTQTVTVTLNSPATIGNTLAVGFISGASTGTISFTSLQDNNATNFTLLQVNGSTLGPNLSGNAVLSGLTNASTSVTLTLTDTASAIFDIDIIVYELSGNLTPDVTNAHAQTTSSTTLPANYTTAAANEFAWVASATNNGNVTVTPTNGWTIDQQPVSTGNTGGFFGHINGAATGATNLGATFDSATITQWNIATLQAPTNGTVVFNQTIAITTTVAALPTCNAALTMLPERFEVTDATSPTYNAALTGGGTVRVPVYCNGSSWSSH